MLKEGKFGYHEAISVTVIMICVRVFFTSPSKVVEIVGTAGWYMTLISALTASFMFVFVYLLLKRFPHKNLMEINDIVLGKVFGSFVSIALGAFFLYVASIDMREFVEVLKVYVLPESPPSFIMVIFMISIVTLSFTGLETIVRYAKFMIYILAGGFLLIVVLSFQNYETHRLFPLLGYGLDKTIINGILRSSFYGQVVVLGVIASSLHDPKEIKRIGFSSLAISGLFTSFALFVFGMVFPYYVGQELTSPMYTFAAQVDVGAFIQRLEPIFLFLWNFGSFIEVAMLFYASMMIFCHTFKIADRKPVILPMATLLYSLNLIPRGIAEVISGLVQTIRTYGFIFYFFPSIFVFIVALIRKKKGESNNA